MHEPAAELAPTRLRRGTPLFARVRVTLRRHFGYAVIIAIIATNGR